ncbi:257_t:CDS:1, partial [Racocetra persica]
LEKPLPKLIVLDLNGTLVCRIKNGRIILRPYIKEFVNYIFNNGFYVMVWSSAQPNNVKKMVTAIFGKYEASLIEVWDRDNFGLSTRQYHTKTLTVKNLEKIWEKLNKLNGKPRWDQLNTILIDDSIKKAQLQPFNSIHLTDFDKRQADEGNDRELFDVIPYLEELRYQSNVSAYIKDFPHTNKKLSGKESYSYDSDDPSFHQTIMNLNSVIKEGMTLNDSSPRN